MLGNPLHRFEPVAASTRISTRRPFDEPTRSAVHTEYLASIEAWRVASGYRLPGEFVIGSGRLA